jgi:cytochrome c5
MRLFPKPLSLFAIVALAACASSGGVSEPATGTAAAPAAPTPTPAAETAPAAELTVSRDQSNRGRNGFLSACTACHGASEFSDSSFKRRWQRRTAGALLDYIAISMPEDSPGSLPPEQYVDIVAYFLGMNGFRLDSSGAEVDEEGLQSLSLAPFSGS